MHRLGYSRTAVATSGHFSHSTTSLLVCIKIISEQDFSSKPRQLGPGRFGMCYLRTLGHYKACEKVLNTVLAMHFAKKQIFRQNLFTRTCLISLVCVLVIAPPL